MVQKLRDIVRSFRAPVKYAFAYGSGVFSQGKSASAGREPQIDLIFGVSHTQHWHSLNIKHNPEHYSSLRHLGSGAVSFIQDKIGAGAYFIPFVKTHGLEIKYGVVNMDTISNDLRKWETLYVAGRLHKPVKILRDEPQLRFLNQANLISVLRAALLLLPEEFSEMDLYSTIAGVSYLGDPRMTFFGENPNKVHNIVSNQFLLFRRLYTPLMDSLPNLELISSDDSALTGRPEVSIARLRQDMNPTRRGNMVVRLPHDLRALLYSRYSRKFNIVASDEPGRTICDEFEKRIASDSGLSQEMARAIRHTVAWPSFTQSVKGILTAGIMKSAYYSLDKMRKYQTGKKSTLP
jgi:translocator assembly and maintenance protein 41